MQTFLNAMTFPDKTMYPVASTNEQDLSTSWTCTWTRCCTPIYRKRAIFEQEGWHYAVAGAEAGEGTAEAPAGTEAADGAAADAPAGAAAPPRPHGALPSTAWCTTR